MTSKLACAVALIFLLTSSEIAVAQDLASQLIGVWKRTSAVRKYTESGYVAQPRELVGVAVFTRGGLFAVTQHAAERKGPEGAVATDAEWAALARSSFFGSGTYKVEGDVVVLRYDSSSNPLWIGEERRATMKVADKVLTWTTPPFKDAWDGKPYVEIVTQTRLE